ncbi:MAG TPA: hypothetical protein VG944_16425 [Fimbriimonas sp.]|nr:hypothetical protein [Fimbriimonas sp.]
MILSTLMLAAALQQPALSCPIAGDPVSGKPGETIEYAGIRFATCCTDCGGTFKKDPAKALKASAEKGKTVGVFLFDPITHARIDDKKAVGFSDYKGVRYEFKSEDEKKTFDADPKKYTARPEKEALFCPVYKTKIGAYYQAGGYVDAGGVRYYVCCDSCLAQMGQEPSKFTANAANEVKAPVAADVTASSE